VHEFYRDIKKPYFRDFFFDKRLYRSIKKDIEWIHSINKDIKVALNKRGLVIYDNYKKNDFNILMLTIHSGHWVPENIIDKHVISAKERAYEEDVGTHKIYGRLVLKNNGIWIDNKLSRYAIDFNRKEEEAIYKDHQEKWLKHVWKKQLDIAEKRWLFECYERFYLTLESLIDTWRFNVIFDGHSMSDADDRPDISFGTTYVPRFYIPIVRQMEKKLKKKGYCSIDENTPYEGGYVNQVLKEKFPDVFILSMEINKKLYHIPNTTKPDDKKVENLSQVLSEIFAFK
ncbi:MAG: N-formylglutamate amidohydrolase, partial [Nanoarchaeota archaeon]|nr:N-formylglutamate amidohydrolase [Nanoarchaeota archaeon]